MKRVVILSLLSAAVAGLFVLTPQKAQIPDQTPEAVSPRDASFSKFIAQAEMGGPIRLIVGLDANFSPVGTLNRTEVAKQGNRIKAAQQSFLSRYSANRGGQDPVLFDSIPFLVIDADAYLLRLMQSDSQVLSIEEDVADPPHLAESTQVIQAPIAWTGGYDGAGWAVAVIDSGVMKTHSFLAGKVISEACYSGANPVSISLCPGGVNSTNVDSGVNCDPLVNGCTHGTHVAGIAAGNGATFSGVARGANIVAIQVFSRFDSAANCGTAPLPCLLSSASDQIRGLERVLALSSTLNIAAVNMSLGGGQNLDYCDITQTARKAAIDNLRSVNIATVISSGNDGFTNAIGAPACISSAFSVGSTGDGSSGATLDAVVSSSNSASFLNFLAPGRWINSSVANSSASFQNFSGTSMAAPHVAGAWAILKQRRPNATVAQVGAALSGTGDMVTDTRNGIVKPRIRVDRAVNAVLETPYDYDLDGRADLSVRRPSNNVWHLLRAAAGYTAMQFGVAGDRMTPSDYDGDGKTDVSVFRPSNGTWHMFMSQSQTFQAFGWGQNGDLPVPMDRDSDGKTDLVIFRPSNNTWYTRFANGTFHTFQFGVTGDKPMVGDFDGDGIGDVALFRPSNNNWYIIKSSRGFFIQTWGQAGDIPTTGDFDGDGATDQAVFRPGTGQWYLSQTRDGFSVRNWGQNGDIPVAADYDGDGKTDVAVFRPSNNNWYIVNSTAGILIQQFGQSGDVPTHTAFLY